MSTTQDLIHEIRELGVGIEIEPGYMASDLVTVPGAPGEQPIPFNFDRPEVDAVLRFALRVAKIAAANALEDARKGMVA